MDKFAEQVEKETNGGIKVEVFPDSQLGGERDNFEGLQLGSLQVSIISTAVSSVFSPNISILDLPFLFKDQELGREQHHCTILTDRYFLFILIALCQNGHFSQEI